MCLDIIVLCPHCGVLAEQRYQQCPNQGKQGHRTYPLTQTVQPPDLCWWTCPTVGCDLNRSLQWALYSMHETALHAGKSHGLKHGYNGLVFSDEGDEACELALSPQDLGPKHQAAPYPNFLNAKSRLIARKMFERGETQQAISKAVGVSSSSLSKYIAAYFKPTETRNTVAVRRGKQLPPPRPRVHVPAPSSPESGKGEEFSYGSEADDVDDEGSPIETIEPVPGAPEPGWLSARQKRLVQRMRRNGETKRAIADALGMGKRRQLVVKYINAYMVPREAAAASGQNPTRSTRSRKRRDMPLNEPLRRSPRLHREGRAE